MIKLLSSKYSYLGILFIGGVLFFQNASTPGFFHDGYLYAALGKNAVLRGNWLVPYLSDSNYPVFAEHPPFIFILEGLFFKLFGFNFFQARIFSGIWGLLVVFMLAKMTEKYIGKGAGFIAGVSILLMPFFIKKVRFPNLDIPLTFFILASVYFFIQAYEGSKEKQNWKQWLMCGLFFGFALLTKGPPAVFLPLSFLFFFLFKKDLIRLKSLNPWIGLSLGILIFLVWPFSLWMTNQSEVFLMWWQRQITGTIVQGRETKELNIFTYFIDLLKIMPIHIVGTIILLRLKKIDLKNNVLLISVIFSTSYLVAISLMKFKYSHYLLPILPFLALLVSTSGSIFSELSHQRFQKVMYFLGLVILAASLVLPFGKEVKRDKFLVEVTQKLGANDSGFKNILLLPSAYEYWAAANYFAYIHQSNVTGVTLDSQVSEDEIRTLYQNYDAAIIPLSDIGRFSPVGPITEIHHDQVRGIVFIIFQ